MAAAVARARGLSRSSSTLSGRSLLALKDGDLIDNVEAFNRPALLEPEIAAVNATATAQSLARLYAVLASRGELDGTRVVSADAVERYRTLQICAPNAADLEADPPPYTVECHKRMLGYHCSSIPYGLPGRLGPSNTAFGHDGLGAARSPSPTPSTNLLRHSSAAA